MAFRATTPLLSGLHRIHRVLAKNAHNKKIRTEKQREVLEFLREHNKFPGKANRMPKPLGYDIKKDLPGNSQAQEDYHLYLDNAVGPDNKFSGWRRKTQRLSTTTKKHTPSK
eukprot:TRINITY_DN3608_c0_g1_i1.p1 TRINITY_DN3608_c0_g1~~TRINITY_DN3608_c0_g1_i1.p1  ORF type:complete len:123 (+),score=33.40 TRINITY_DN3608_c0_g1_i1:34-369(+)